MVVETTISKNYVHNWGIKEGVRELIQNALDANDLGYKMDITYSRRNKSLIIANRGISIPRSSLLLGSTTKLTDENQRGKNGEGYKIGSLALVRGGKKVKILNGKEQWDCIIDKSESFESDVLKFEIKDLIFSAKDIKFIVEGITPEEWNSISKMFLSIDIPQQKSFINTPQGTILFESKYKGKIFCGGIYIDSHKDLEYGYDFKVSVLSLNRDRNMANSFDVEWNTSKMWSFVTMNIKGKINDTHEMLKRGVPDVKYLKECSDYTVSGKMVEKFLDENKELRKPYPVSSEEEARRVRSIGYTPVFSSSSYVSTLRDSMGDIDKLERTVSSEYAIFHSITPIDDANLKWVFEVMFKIDPKFKFEITLANFEVTSTRALSKQNNLILNSNLLKYKYDILFEAINHYSIIKNKLSSHIWKDLYQSTIEGMKE